VIRYFARSVVWLVDFNVSLQQTMMADLNTPWPRDIISNGYGKKPDDEPVLNQSRRRKSNWIGYMIHAEKKGGCYYQCQAY